MPSGDEGTGLHAFDDLDPISTVSALNAMPDDADERPRMPAGAPRSAPPPPPGRRFGTLPIGGDGHGTSSGVRSTPPSFAPGSLPPAPRSGAAARSVPPPPPSPPRLRDTTIPPGAPQVLHGDDAERESDGDEDTRVVPNAFANDPEYGAVTSSARSTDDESDPFEDFGSSGHGARGVDAGADDGDLAELSATTVATNIDMDWDEEDVKTKLRDEEADGASISGAHAPVAAPFVSGRPSPFPSAMPSPYAGNPSPFSAAPAPGYAPQNQPLNWESEEEAMTRVMASPTLPPPALPRGMSWGADSLAPASNTATVSGTHGGALDPRLMKLAGVGVAAAALIGAAFGARALLTNDEPGTVTIVTKPTDAEVIVNGRPIESGKSSPFTVQDLAPGQEHSIVVRKTGYAEQTHHFELEGGEVKALPNVELTPLRLDTGFTLSSVPEGASIYVDDVKLAATTPSRITDLKPGLHVIRLELGDGYQPWETQVALASGQVIELPTARLVGGGGTRASNKVAAAPSSPRSSGSSSSRSSRRSSDRSSRTSRTAAPVQTASAPVRFAPVPASQPKVSGAQGTLRLNSRPWAQVFVDGRMVGNTPVMNMPLSAGSHSIKLVNPQLGMSKNLKVKIQNGQVTTKIVELME
jgi:hypothetical protein